MDPKAASSRERSGSLRAGALLSAVLALLATGAAMAAPEPPVEGEPASQPNIVVFMTDDQALNSFTSEVMPRTAELIAGPGTVFSDFVVSTPLCCPSRATFLTGQYSHNNGVVTNFPGYADLRDKESTLPAWLDAAGYRTAHVGKFLHGYEETASDPAAPAPGFDEWRAMLRPFSYYGFDLSENGTRVTYDRESYLTSELTDQAVDVVRQKPAISDPLFLSVAYWAPHGTRNSPGGTCDRAPAPAPQDRDLFAGERLPRPESFDERDVSDKPEFIQARPRLSREKVQELRRRYRCTLASLQAVDRGVKRVYEALEAEGEADNTVFVFTSDNGYFFGEHRLNGKSLPYEEGIRVPLAIRLPAELQPQGHIGAVDEPTANIDLAPTLLELAGAEPCVGGGCRTLDGRSLLPLMQGQGSWPAERGILIESNRNEFDGRSCRYRAIRTAGLLYAEHASVFDPRTRACKQAADRERYDLGADPLQLQNLYPAEPGSDEARFERDLSNRVEALATCAGIEGRDPAPATGDYCE